MTRSGWTVLLARSKAFTNARFSAALICMIFLLTGARLMGWRKTGEQEEREYRKRENKGEEQRKRGAKKNVIKN